MGFEISVTIGDGTRKAHLSAKNGLEGILYGDAMDLVSMSAR